MFCCFSARCCLSSTNSLISLRKHHSFPDQQTDIPREHPPPQERSCLACTYQATHQKQTHAIRRPSKISIKRGEPPRAPKRDSNIHWKTFFLSIPPQNPFALSDILVLFLQTFLVLFLQNRVKAKGCTKRIYFGVRSFWHSHSPCTKTSAREGKRPRHLVGAKFIETLNLYTLRARVCNCGGQRTNLHEDRWSNTRCVLGRCPQARIAIRDGAWPSLSHVWGHKLSRRVNKERSKPLSVWMQKSLATPPWVVGHVEFTQCQRGETGAALECRNME